MATHPRTFDPAGDAWDVLDRLVEEVDRLARTAPPPAVFWRELLRRIVEGLAAEGGVVWTCDGGGRPMAEGRYEFGRPAAVDGDLTPEAARLAPAAAAARARRAADLGPQDQRAADSKNGSPADGGLLVAPVVVDDRPTAVIELSVGRELEPDTREAVLRLLERLAETAADYQRERQRLALADEAEGLRQVDDFVLRLHSAADATAMAYVLANEAARLLPCDRAAVLYRESGGCRAVAVSGADTVDRRSPQVRGLEQLSAAVVAEGAPLRVEGNVRRVAASATAALDAYLATSNVRAIAVEPLVTTDAALGAEGVLVVENFAGAARATTEQPWNEARLRMLVRHGAVGLARARELDAVPGAFRRRRTTTGSGRRRWWLGLAVVALVGPFLIPAEFKLEARGVLQPVNRRDVFAPADGIVQEILVRDGQLVAAQDVLVRLRRPELDVELARVLGEIETAQSRLASIRALRTGAPGDAAAVRRGQELTAEEEQLKKTLAGRNDELKLLRVQQTELEIRAPLAGRVIAWDLEQTLAGRPVARGARLLEVADVTGAWIVDLRVAERHAGDLAEARGPQGKPLDVELIAAVAPDRRFEGRLVRVAPAAEIDPDEGVVVPAVVEASSDAADATDRRPGAVVTAKIRCGRRSLGYVWWHEAWRGLRSLWF